MDLNQLMKSASVEVPVEKKIGSHRNRLAGHRFERWCVNFFQALGFPHVRTSRAESRSRDNDKIDLTNTDESINGRFPYNVQCKCTTQLADYNAIFNGRNKRITTKRGEKVYVQEKGMPKVKGVINVIIHKLTKKGQASTFIPQGTFVIMSVEDFEIMVKDRLELEGIKKVRAFVKEGRIEEIGKLYPLFPHDVFKKEE
jgi:hypothetical protein